MRDSSSKYSSCGDLKRLHKIRKTNSCTCKVSKPPKPSWMIRVVLNVYELVKGTLKLGETVDSESNTLLTNKPEDLLQNDDEGVCKECSRTKDSVQNCQSCAEDSPASIICSLCQKFIPDLGNSSCKKCQDTRPVIKMCLKYHGRQPEFRVCPCWRCNNKRQLIEQFCNGIRYDNGDKCILIPGRKSRYFPRERKRLRNVKQTRASSYFG